MKNSDKAQRTYAGQSLDVRVAERRSALIAAGFELIGTQGFRAATVRAVCKEAGLTDRYFYESFANGEAFLSAVYREVSLELKQRLTTAIQEAGPTLEMKLGAGLGAFFQFMRDPRNARIMMAEVLGVSEAVTALYLRTTVEFAELILHAVTPYVPALAEAGESRRVIGQALIGAAIYAAGAWALSGYRQAEMSLIDSCRYVFVGTLKQFAEEQGRETPR